MGLSKQMGQSLPDGLLLLLSRDDDRWALIEFVVFVLVLELEPLSFVDVDDNEGGDIATDLASLGKSLSGSASVGVFDLQLVPGLLFRCLIFATATGSAFVDLGDLYVSWISLI